MRFIDEHKGVFGVEPVCRVLTGHGADRTEHLLRRQDPPALGTGGA